MNAMSMARCFAIGPIVMSAEPYGNGHINNTYRVVTPMGVHPAEGEPLRVQETGAGDG